VGVVAVTITATLSVGAMPVDSELVFETASNYNYRNSARWAHLPTRRGIGFCNCLVVSNRLDADGRESLARPTRC